MRKYSIAPLFYTMVLLSFISCKKDFLNVVPVGTQIASTTDDYTSLMNDIKFYYIGNGWNEPMLMGDEVAAEPNFLTQGTPFNVSLFEWRDTIYKPADPQPEFLTALLQGQYTLNKIINEIGGASGGTQTQKDETRAEALATRAWNNMQYINYYAKPYAAATAATDPGFPIINQADLTITKYTRATVQQVYDTIISDLKTAILSLPVKPSIQTHMSRPSAEGLLGKLYLFMGRYSDALPMFDAAFSDLSQSNFARLYDYNQAFGPGGSFLPIDPTNGPVNAPGKKMNDLTEAIVSKVWLNYPYNYPLSNVGTTLAPWAAALYKPSDLRLLFYTTKNADGTQNAGGRLRKYEVTFSRMGLQLPDLYLLRAECKARLNDLSGAKADVETLRTNRMPAGDATVDPTVAGDQVALIKFIIDERTREFAMEGYRWFDIRRLSVDPLFAGSVYNHTIYNADGTTAVFTLNQPKRLVLQLPPNVMTAYPDLVNNP